MVQAPENSMVIRHDQPGHVFIIDIVTHTRLTCSHEVQHENPLSQGVSSWVQRVPYLTLTRYLNEAQHIHPSNYSMLCGRGCLVDSKTWGHVEISSENKLGKTSLVLYVCVWLYLIMICTQNMSKAIELSYIISYSFRNNYSLLIGLDRLKLIELRWILHIIESVLLW